MEAQFATAALGKFWEMETGAGQELQLWPEQSCVLTFSETPWHINIPPIGERLRVHWNQTPSSAIGVLLQPADSHAALHTTHHKLDIVKNVTE